MAWYSRMGTGPRYETQRRCDSPPEPPPLRSFAALPARSVEVVVPALPPARTTATAAPHTAGLPSATNRRRVVGFTAGPPPAQPQARHRGPRARRRAFAE